MQWLLPRCLRFVRGAVKEILPSMDNNLIIAATRLLTALLLPDPDDTPAAKTVAGKFRLTAQLGLHALLNEPFKDILSSVAPGDAMRHVEYTRA